MSAESAGVGHLQDSPVPSDLNRERHWTSPSVLAVTQDAAGSD